LFFNFSAFQSAHCFLFLLPFQDSFMTSAASFTLGFRFAPAPKSQSRPNTSVSTLKALGLACAMVLSGAGASHAQSLAELHEVAKAYDATYRSARLAYDAAVAKADQARAGLLPTAGLASGLSWTNVDNASPVRDRTFNSQNVAVSGSYPLYRPANKLSFEQGQKSLAVAQSQLQAVEQDLIVRITQAYFDVLAAQDTLEFVKAQKTAVAEQLAAAKRNFEVGTSTITDAREAQARFDLVQAQEIAAENDLHVKKFALDNLTGKTGTSPKPLLTPVNLPNVAPNDVATWVNQAETEHPSVVQAKTALEIAKLETAKAKAANGPTVDLTAQYQIARAPSSTTGNPLRSNTASVGVQLNMPLFSGYAIENRIKETLALESKAESDLEAAKRAVGQATRAAFFGVQSGNGQAKALEAAEISSQSALDANKLGYQVGVRINIDVLNAQSQLFQTKRDLAKARYDVLVGNLKLRQATGRLSVDDLKVINSLIAP
jgi:outer membrane protein